MKTIFDCLGCACTGARTLIAAGCLARLARWRPHPVLWAVVAVALLGIASMLQQEERRGNHVPVIILTHAAQEKNFTAALAELDALDVVGAAAVRLRIEDFGSL